LVLSELIIVLLVGQVVSHEEGVELAREFGISFFETSAHTNTNVDNAITSIATNVKSRLDSEALERTALNKLRENSDRKLKQEKPQQRQPCGWC
jgi:hypothetical protein